MRRGFSRRRGRPCTPRPQTDTGTPELMAKRAGNLTAETIDRLYQQGLINDVQLWCALHLRWLYALRYGRPTVQAYDLTGHSHYQPPQQQDEDWRIRRMLEYRSAAESLQQEGLLAITLNVVVYDCALQPSLNQPNKLHSLTRGLDILTTLWRK